MRIGIDANPLLWRKTTGVQNHSRGICTALAELADGDEFVLLYERSARGVSGFDDSFVRSLPDNWQVVSANVPGPTGGSARYLWEHWGLPRLLKRHAADVYYSPATRGPFTRSCPTAITIHDLAKEACGEARSVPRPLARLARRATRIFTVSDAARGDVERILGIGPDRMVTVYNAPAPGVVAGSESHQQAVCERFGLSRSRYLLCVGDENWRRKYDLLWATMESFWAAGQMESAAVVFVGRQDWRTTDLYARVCRGSWRDGAVFLNNVGNEDLGSLYGAALATVVPTRAEGFGMPVVEAMACGCPVLCSDIPVLREVAGRAVRYFDLDSQASLAEGIRALAGDAAVRVDLSRRGRARARRYTWEAAARTVLQTLRSIAGARLPATGDPRSSNHKDHKGHEGHKGLFS